MTSWFDAGAVAKMKFTPGHAIQLDDRWLAVFPLDEGYRVIDNACPHANAPLCDSTLRAGKVICHLHLWEFDLATGECDVGPDWAVKTYAARVVDGHLQVELP